MVEFFSLLIDLSQEDSNNFGAGSKKVFKVILKENDSVKGRKEVIYIDSEMQKGSYQSIKLIDLNKEYCITGDEKGDLQKLKAILQKEYILFIFKFDGKYECPTPEERNHLKLEKNS